VSWNCAVVQELVLRERIGDPQPQCRDNRPDWKDRRVEDAVHHPLADQAIPLFEIEIHLLEDLIGRYLSLYASLPQFLDSVPLVEFHQQPDLQNLPNHRRDEIAEEEESEDIAHLVLFDGSERLEDEHGEGDEGGIDEVDQYLLEQNGGGEPSDRIPSLLLGSEVDDGGEDEVHHLDGEGDRDREEDVRVELRLLLLVVQLDDEVVAAREDEHK
jgi:hypothetical protein